MKHENLLNYLGCKFIVNLSELPLVASYAPVIFYKQLMEAAGNYVGATGLVAKGLQIFYPIHPRLIGCFFAKRAKSSKKKFDISSIGDTKWKTMSFLVFY